MRPAQEWRDDRDPSPLTRRLTRRTKCRVKRRVFAWQHTRTVTPQIGVDSLGVFRR